MNDKVCIVGIAGGTASGKTTIVRMIKEKFGDDIVVGVPSIESCFIELFNCQSSYYG